ncbi:hypothetical protein HYV49_03365 [Candidatus Pacearchaeota archaeon]|nr:hypothetical protein [Candidatus Pacearchaeota archaeon]
MKNKILVTIVTRNNEVMLRHLIESIEKNDSGYEYDLLLLDTESDDKKHLFALDEFSKKYKVQTVVDDRVEVTYNIAWKENQDYQYYFFMHDDCHVERKDWLKVFVDRMNSGYYEQIIENTHFKNLPIGRVSIGNQFWRDYYSVKGHSVQCVFLKYALELIYPGKVPEIFKLVDCDRLLIKADCLFQIGGFRNIKEFVELKKQNIEIFDKLCNILNSYLPYPDEGMYPKEIYPPGEYWNKITLTTEYMDSIDPLIKGWRGVGLYDDGYLEQIHGFDVPRQHRYITHYGSPNYREFIAKKFNSNREEVRKYFKDKIFLIKCDKLFKEYLEKHGDI